jgi:hypothetical protein
VSCDEHGWPKYSVGEGPFSIVDRIGLVYACIWFHLLLSYSVHELIVVCTLRAPSRHPKAAQRHLLAACTQHPTQPHYSGTLRVTL